MTSTTEEQVLRTIAVGGRAPTDDGTPCWMNLRAGGGTSAAEFARLAGVKYATLRAGLRRKRASASEAVSSLAAPGEVPAGPCGFWKR